MAGQVRLRGIKEPADRTPSDRPEEGQFFPREVVQILGIPFIDYQQLRTLYGIARQQAGHAKPGRQWARYSVTDIACIERLIQIGGGPTALAKGQGPRFRIDSAPLLETCRALREMGYQNPLLEVVIVRQGRQYLAEVSGSLFNPATGQQTLDRAMGGVGMYLGPQIDERLAERLQDGARRLPVTAPEREERRARLAISSPPLF
jgi:hypothetical protein